MNDSVEISSGRASTRGKVRGALLVVAVLVATVAVAGAPGRAEAAGPGYIGDTSGFTSASLNAPSGIATGADGNLWIANQNANSIVRLTPAGVFTTFTDPSVNRPRRIVLGPDGNMWFTNSAGDSIGRITPAGVVSSFTAASVHDPNDIVVGPDGALWFTNMGVNFSSTKSSIGRVTTGGSISSFKPVQLWANRLAATSDGLVFTSLGEQGLSHITTAGVITPTTEPFSGDSPQGVVEGSDGNLWYADATHDAIVRVNGDSTLTSFTFPGLDQPEDLTVGADGNVWVSAYTGVFSVTPTGGFTRFTWDQTSGGITVGPDQQIWATSRTSTTITRIIDVGLEHTVPSVPIGVTAIPGNGMAAVAWSAPTNNGGLGISEYEVTAHPGGATCIGGTTSCVVTGLTNGTSYTFSVRARNGIGFSSSSVSSAAVVPAAGPGFNGSGFQVGGPKTSLSADADGTVTIARWRGDLTDMAVSASPVCSGGATPESVTFLLGADRYQMTLTGSVWSTTVPKASVTEGQLTLEMTCPGQAPIVMFVGSLTLYDPSGHLTDAVSGDPIAGAEVTLYRVPSWSPRFGPGAPETGQCETNLSKAEGASWTQTAPTALGVEEDPGNEQISPTVNPFISSADGYYGWDVPWGCWYVVVQAAGYAPLTSPVVGVPTEVTDLDLQLIPETDACSGSGAGPFVDVPTSHQFCTEITWLASSGVTEGYSDHTFRPVSSVTRGAMAAFLYRFAGSPPFTSPVVSPFSDVATTHPFYKEITWLASTGVTEGYSDHTFRPVSSVTRGAMAAFLYRFAESPPFTSPVVSPFSDVETTHPFYKEITWLASTGVTEGYSDHTFRPVSSVTRGAMAAFLYRYDNG